MRDGLNLDVIAVLDDRIARARTRRAAAERFSEAYWEADDELAWLRMVREEAARTGHVRGEAAGMLAVPPVALAISAGDAPALDLAAPSGAARATARDEVDDTLLTVRVA